MTRQSFETSDTPHLTIEMCAGNLTITGSTGRQVSIEVDGTEEHMLITQREGETITLTAQANCSVTTPLNTSLTIRQVTGDLHATCLSGPLAVESVQGNVFLRDVTLAAARSVVGNFEARRVGSELSVGDVQGSMRVRQCLGKLVVNSCHKDLNIRDLMGGVEVQNVHGDVWLRTELTPGRAYQLRAQGDIKAHISPDSGAQCRLEAQGLIHCGVSLSESEQTPRCVTGRLGGGQAQLELCAAGDVVLQAEDYEWGAELETRLEAFIEAEMNDLSQRLQEELADLGDVGPRFEEKMRRRAEKTVEQTRRQAEKVAERTRRRAEKMEGRIRREAEKAAERARRTSGESRWKSLVQFGKPSEARRTPASEPISADEHLAILRMLEQKKISSEEAARLLAALEGQTE